MAERDTQVGAFLRARREQLDPDEVGVLSYGTRRVRGLRREEVAQLAGVSPSYYTRIEQGQAQAVSPEVLHAIARALRLDTADREHLLRLSSPLTAVAGDPGDEVVGRPLRVLLDHLDRVPAALLGRRLDVLAWTEPCRLLFAPYAAPDAPDHPHTRPNWARMVLLDPDLRTAFGHWDRKVDDVVGVLRAHRARFPDDEVLADLVAELVDVSPVFAERWAEHVLRDRSPADVVFRHPLAGDLELVHQSMRLPDHDDWILGTYVVARGSLSEQRLGALMAPQRVP